ncbi:MAG: hypothetical protein V3W41_16915 [Planctomycetota bacterium]
MSEEELEEEVREDQKKEFPCSGCGSKLVFQPGTTDLGCGYCGYSNPIPQSEADIEELDFRAHLESLAAEEPTDESADVACSSCGAITTKPANLTAFHCPFCASPMVTEEVARRLIRPKSLLPFKVTFHEAKGSFKKWLAGHWFAPTKLKTYADTGELKGLYVPYWTYDSDTESFYRGQRGDDYWETNRVSFTDAQGRAQTRNQRTRKTRWRSVSGTVWVQFDDLLVAASKSLPLAHLNELTPWDLSELVPYSPDYLSGFEAERYQVELDDGFEAAETIMERGIRQAARRDIGGDHQRISALKTGHSKVTFKHILMPIYISAYRYRGKVYRFLINARTGEVQGDRPYSIWKITFTILAILATLALVILIVTAS